MEPAHEGLGLLPSGVEVEGHGQKEIGEWAWHVNLHAPQNHHRPTVELLHVNHAVNQLLGNAEGLGRGNDRGIRGWAKAGAGRVTEISVFLEKKGPVCWLTMISATRGSLESYISVVKRFVQSA